MLADTAFPPPEKPLSFTCVPTAAVAGIKVAFVERRLFGGLASTRAERPRNARRQRHVAHLARRGLDFGVLLERQCA